VSLVSLPRLLGLAATYGASLKRENRTKLTRRLHRALQAKALELERQRATDNLKKGLAHRPDRDTLVERNILPDSNAAPALQGHQKELERHMRADSLEKGLQSRPAPDELIRKGILDAEENPLKE